jgi:hypothetical protein
MRVSYMANHVAAWRMELVGWALMGGGGEALEVTVRKDGG